MVGQGLDARIEVGVAQILAAQHGISPRVAVADIALPEPVIQKDFLAASCHDVLEEYRQRQFLLAPQGELKGFERIKLVVGRQAEINARDPIKRLGKMLDDRANGEGS